jgi:predicted alpha/beta superfamily hydrolase
MKYVFAFLLFLFTSIHSFGQKTPFSIGVIDSIKSIELNETRILNIYLPEGYSADSAQTYNVIYLLDGSADEDFIHIAGLVQFCNFEWINILPPTIVVGIANVDRKRDFTFPAKDSVLPEIIRAYNVDFSSAGGSDKFMSFIETELQPFINKNYKTNSNKMLIGQSLGGLLATEILYKKPHLFNQYMIISPSLWWDYESLLNYDAKVLQPTFTQKLEIFVAVGNEGKVMEGDAKKLYKKLKNSNSSSVSVDFKFLGNKNHATIMHQAILNGFEAFNELKTVQ